jgi:hypothetical protein
LRIIGFLYSPPFPWPLLHAHLRKSIRKSIKIHHWWPFRRGFGRSPIPLWRREACFPVPGEWLMFDFRRVDCGKSVGRSRNIKKINRIRIARVFFHPARLKQTSEAHKKRWHKTYGIVFTQFILPLIFRRVGIYVFHPLIFRNDAMRHFCNQGIKWKFAGFMLWFSFEHLTLFSSTIAAILELRHALVQSRRKKDSSYPDMYLPESHATFLRQEVLVGVCR